MCRCKACDIDLSETEIVWRADYKIWEDLCRTCLHIVFYNDTSISAPDCLILDEDVGEIDNDEGRMQPIRRHSN